MWTPCFQWVICRRCHDLYQCLPERDYFNSTSPEDGVCGGCLMAEARA